MDTVAHELAPSSNGKKPTKTIQTAGKLRHADRLATIGQLAEELHTN